MNGLWTIACGSGLQDGLDPCRFMACSVFIVYGLWLKRNSLRTGWPCIIFALAYAAGFLEFNFGPAQIFVFQKDFIFAARIIYFILGAGFFIAGILYFKDWVLLKRGLSVQAQADKGTRPFPVGKVAVFPATIVLGLLLSALSTLWPVNNYIMLLGNESLLRGQWLIVMPLLAVYVFSAMWPLWFVWAFLGIKNFQPSLLKIFCASIFFTASSCMIFIFK